MSICRWGSARVRGINVYYISRTPPRPSAVWTQGRRRTQRSYCATYCRIRASSHSYTATARSGLTATKSQFAALSNIRWPCCPCSTHVNFIQNTPVSGPTRRTGEGQQTVQSSVHATQQGNTAFMSQHEPLLARIIGSKNRSPLNPAQRTFWS